VTLEELEGRLHEILGGGVGNSLPEGVFQELALGVFRHQCRRNPAYGAFVARRGIEVESVSRWEEIPFLPARAFKTARLVTGEPTPIEAVFRTSGTTGGPGRRGEHHVADLDLYRKSLLPNFEAHLLPDIQGKVRILCLMPDPGPMPESSLSFMMAEVVRARGDGESGFFADAEGRIDEERLGPALLAAAAMDTPVLLAGTALGWVAWLEKLRNRVVPMPTGSRIMETGGYKGRRHTMSRGELYRGLTRALGVPEGHIVSEYGMTELLSQFYDRALPRGPRDGAGSGAPPLRERFYRGPPWVRSLILDPLTLRPLGQGEVGVLAHLDLANLHSVSPVLTEDLGRGVEQGFQLMGRSPGSELRGCSLAMEDFLAAAGRGEGP
jgi:hypothetical protein